MTGGLLSLSCFCDNGNYGHALQAQMVSRFEGHDTIEAPSLIERLKLYLPETLVLLRVTSPLLHRVLFKGHFKFGSSEVHPLYAIHLCRMQSGVILVILVVSRANLIGEVGKDRDRRFGPQLGLWLKLHTMRTCHIVVNMYTIHSIKVVHVMNRWRKLCFKSCRCSPKGPKRCTANTSSCGSEAHNACEPDPSQVRESTSMHV